MSDETKDGDETLPAADDPAGLFAHIRRLRERGHTDRGPVTSGGMAWIHEVEDPALGRRSAKKVIRPELLDETWAAGSFVREAQITGRLDHPGATRDMSPPSRFSIPAGRVV